MTRIQAETLEQVLEFFRYYARDDKMREAMHVLGIGDAMIDDAIAALKQCAHSPNSPATCSDCRESSPCACARQPRLF